MKIHGQLKLARNGLASFLRAQQTIQGTIKMHKHFRSNFSMLSKAIALATADHKVRGEPSRAFRLAFLTASGAAFLSTALNSTQTLAAQNEETIIDEVVVTGSRIRRQDYEANSPITTVDSSLFEQTSTVGVETILNQLPQFVPGVTQFSTTNVQNEATSTVGASTVSLRGLGANRNLVLINGRRGQPVNAALTVDTNSIPSSMIQRVEVISGGASAVYGADAIGGVVNFILKDNYEGASLSTRYGMTQDGLNEEYQVSGLFGADVADGRGNVMFGMEYASRQEVNATEVDWRVEQLNNPNIAGGDNFINETYLEPITASNRPSQAAIDKVFSALPPGTITQLSAGGRYLMINPTVDGTGTVFTGGGPLANTATIPGLYKYKGPFERPEYPGVSDRKFMANGALHQNSLDQWVSIPLERFSFSSKGRFEFNDSITGNMEARYSKNRNETVLGFPPSALSGNAAFIPYGDSDIYLASLANQNAVTGYDKAMKPIFNTALLATTPTNPAYRTGGAYGLNCPALGGCTESNAFPFPQEVRNLLNSRPNPNEDVKLNRPLDFLGVRSTQTDTQTFQMITGLDGKLKNDWVWDTYFTHGQTETLVNFNGFASLDRWRGVVQAPNFGVNFRGQNNSELGGQFSGVATCTSGLPVVREFQMSADCFKAIGSNLQNSTKLEQNTFEMNLNGDLLALPAGTLQFSVGASYRDEAYEFNTDNLTSAESFVETALGLYPTSNTLGEFDTKELYGELLVPVISGLPGIKDLRLELGARLSDYSTVGEVDTYKALVDWTIVDWARVRGGYQRANRAPNIGELFLSPTYRRGATGATFGDQCSMDSEGPYSTNPAFNANGQSGANASLALCQAMMGPIATEFYAVAAADQPSGTGLARDEGSLGIQSEEAETWTLGLVLRSPSDDAFWGGFKGSIDWYEIEITDMIALESGDSVFERCLSTTLNPSGSPDTPACTSIGRDPLTGGVQYVGRSYTNEGRALTSGIDVQVDWSGDFSFGAISLNVLGNYNMENITQAFEGVAEIDWVGTTGCELGLECMGYDYRVFTTLSWSDGPYSTSLRWQYYPEIDSGAKARDPNARTRGVHSSYSNFALTAGYRVNDNLSLRMGIDNLFDRLPPFQGGEPWRVAENPLDYNRAPTRAGGGVYDPLGRRFYVSANMQF
jgi:iron complex outermembrane recepter protein